MFVDPMTQRVTTAGDTAGVVSTRRRRLANCQPWQTLAGHAAG
ncbi:hypothetical protein Poly24_10220 [Rosistilla carotiformis]|uniref:Uncharacterized protein n=1 Tax=Rosistilla carotiformis TaxID=2528017 RepID=A0A518JP50_9BACT|nr:hypothetical protein [Rosistilla carotiformis]QDV67329.1 hypothetical protein Poly24_10220 [Rosistilla carotiformis]